MQYITEKSILDFHFWRGARDNANRFTVEELEQIEELIDEEFWGKIPNEEDINDLFWFNEATLCEYLDIDLNDFWNRESTHRYDPF